MARKIQGRFIPRRKLALAVAAALVPFAGAHSQTTTNTLPTGGQVAAGTATISQPAANKLQIDQASDKAVLNWQSFSIGSGAWVNFTQPSASSIALNRVLGTNPSEIFGRLTANGQVFLSNPSGVLFAPGASVDVGGLFATTLSINDADFLAGNYNFYNGGGAGSVVNQGVITATGYAALAGPQVRNDGVIVAQSGTVALAAGDRVSLDMVGDGLISVSVDQAALNASAINSGTLQADGGRVVLTARSANALLDTVVNNGGVIQANSLVTRNGEIVLDGGTAGTVVNAGALQGTNANIAITGNDVEIAPGTIVNVGGGVVTANAGHDMTVNGAVVASSNMNVSVGGTLTLDATSGNAALNSSGGQTISANELVLHAEGNHAATLVNTSGNQVVTTGAGGINLEVAADGRGVAQIVNQRSTTGLPNNGTQAVSTGGLLNVVGGSISASAVNSGVFQNQTGKQTVTAGSISLHGANAAVNSGGAFISNTSGGGDQEIDVFAAGTISLKGGGIGLSNRAGITTNGNQTINGIADITVEGGDSGNGTNAATPTTPANSSNAAFISANAAGKTQTINAHNITLKAGAGGNDTFAAITSDTQTITATGDVSIAGGANTGPSNGARIGAGGASGTGTNLTLQARSVTLKGGTTDSAAVIGNSGAANTRNLANKITIATTTGDVILNSGDGSGARIGAPNGDTGAGSISITAMGGRIALNPDSAVNASTIRTAGDVTLNAGSVSEAPNGQILAGSLAATIGGAADLGGSNAIAKITGLSAGGTLNLNNVGTLTLDATSANARISSVGGQTITADGLVLHAEGDHASSITNTSGNQAITVGAGGINLQVGADGRGVAQIANNRGALINGTQTVSTTGALAVTGGSTTTSGFNSGVFQNQTGRQTVSAGSISLQAANAAVNSGGAFISNTSGGGDQEIDVAAGTISLKGGGIGLSNRAGISTNGNQTINGNADITLEGGDSGNGTNAATPTTPANSSNAALISIVATVAGKTQTINAHSITLQAGSGGTDTFAAITNNSGVAVGNSQIITATGDVSLTGGANSGVANGARIGAGVTSTTGTNLSLTAQNVFLKGGTTASAAVIGNTSSAATPNLPNNITITAGGDVKLNSGDGDGTRIGAPNGDTGAGRISITATSGRIALNPDNAVNASTIRTAADVTLNAASISEAPNSQILAHSLTANAGGALDLGGSNAISVFSGTSGGGMLLNNTGALQIGGLSATDASVTTTGAAADLTLAGNVSATNVALNAGGAISEASNGSIVSQVLTTSSVGSTSLGGPNQISSFGASSGGSLLLNNSGALVLTGITANGTMTLANAGAISMNASGTADAVVTSTGGQSISADSLSLHAQDGRLARIINDGGDQTISAGAGGIDLVALNGQGSAQIVNAKGVQLDGTQNVSTTGLLNVVGGSTSNGSGAFNSGVFQAQTGKQTVTAGSISLQAAVAGVSTGGALIINTDGGPASDQEVNVASGTIRLTGGGVGLNNRAGIQTSGNQAINGNADIFLTGGNSGSGTQALGTANSALITAGKTQMINAHDLTLKAGSGGTDTFAAITSDVQTIKATGDVKITGGSNAGVANGARIGASSRTGVGTNLTLTAHDVTLTGGDTSAAVIGNTAIATTPNLPNNIAISASGDVVLNSGAGNGARVGAPNGDTGAGNISITANGKIALNPDDATHASMIRTAGDVTLNAGGTISEAANGFIIAHGLTTTSGGSTLLGGPNQVSVFNATSIGDSVLLTNTGALEVTGLNAFGDATLDNTGNVTISGPWTAGGTTRITVHSDLLLQSKLTSHDVFLTATSGSIQESGSGAVDAASLTTSSVGDTTLSGDNTVSSFSASSSTGGITLNNSGALTVTSLQATGAIELTNDGALTFATPVDTSGQLTLASHGDLQLTDSVTAGDLVVRSLGGNVTLGGADLASSVVLHGTRSLTLEAPGQILVRGSDCAAGAGAYALSDGALTVNAGSFSLVGGAAPFAPAVAAGNVVDVATLGNLSLTGGSGFLSPALLLGGTGIDLTVGGTLKIDGGSGDGSFARVQTATRDGEIRITFTNESGDYVVDGLDGRIKHGQDGFYTGIKPAKPGDTFFVTY